MREPLDYAIYIMIEIHKISELENANYNEALSMLGDSIHLAADLHDLYELIGRSINDNKLPLEKHIASYLQFLLGARYQLTIGMLSSLRGHSNDSFFFLRRSIELCAFAARVIDHPHLADVWVEAADSDESYNTYRTKFSPGKIFSSDKMMLGKLYDRYDKCSKLSHASIYSFADQLEVSYKDDTWQMKLQYFTLYPKTPSEPVASFLYTADTHFMIIRVFVKCLCKIEGYNPSTLNSRISAFDTKIRSHKIKWQHVITDKGA